MTFLVDLFQHQSVAHAVLIFSLVIALGIGVGSIRIFGVRLGVAGVLFSGLLFGHFDLSVEGRILGFVREFGLILFVYTIGLQVGPGFFTALKKNGLRLNVLAALIVLGGVVITVVLQKTGLVPTAAAVGLFSGATTNTPSLGAAQEALRVIPGISPGALKLPGLAYAMAYPFGILGIILAMLTIRTLFRIKPDEEAELFQKLQPARPSLSSVDIMVENENLDGAAVKDIPILKDKDIVISRVMHGENVEVPQRDTKLFLGDIIHAVGPKAKLRELVVVVGSLSPIDLRADVRSDVVTRNVIVTKSAMVGRTIQEVCLSTFKNITVTRVNRAGVELVANPDLTLELADSLLVVGEEVTLKKLAVALGDSSKDLDIPFLAPVFVGIALGVILGKLPIQLPGMPAAIKLGLAGGPLLVAICLSRIGHFGPLIWYMPRSANFMLRELGIALFLACVGLRSGDEFIQTLTAGPGLAWMGWAALITLVPLLAVAVIARLWLKINYLSICGLLAGSMTDPPALAFANAQSKSNATSLAYATVYPLVMILRVVAAQLLVIFLMR